FSRSGPRSGGPGAGERGQRGSAGGGREEDSRPARLRLPLPLRHPLPRRGLLPRAASRPLGAPYRAQHLPALPLLGYLPEGLLLLERGLRLLLPRRLLRAGFGRVVREGEAPWSLALLSFSGRSTGCQPVASVQQAGSLLYGRRST